MSSAPKKAIILAAGRGKRLGDLTLNRPKPMVEIQGKPALEHILIGLCEVGVTEFLLVVGYLPEVIRDYFGTGNAWGVRIAYTLQETPTGTGSALALGRNFAGEEPFLMSFGDILTDYAHYRALVAEFTAAPCAAVIGINPVEDPTAGSAVYREGNRIVRIVEKPKPGASTSNWNSAGISAYDPSIWPAVAALQPSPRGEYELTDATSALIMSGQEVRGCEFTGFWSDVGTPEALAEAERDWRANR